MLSKGRENVHGLFSDQIKPLKNMYKESIINSDLSMKFGTVQRRPAIGNAFVKWHSIPIGIKRYFTDVNGTIVNKNTVPAALQVEYPFIVFGDFDRQGGYNTAMKAVPPVPGTFYLMTFTNGYGFIPQNLTGFSGANNVKDVIGFGDIVHVYTDDAQNPGYFVWVVIKNNYGAIASIIGNSETQQRDGLLGKIYLEQFNYSTDNPGDQWANPIHFVRSSNISTWGDNQVQPYIFKTPDNEQEQFITIKCEFNMDQFLALVNNFYFATESIQWNFRVRPATDEVRVKGH